MYVFWFHNTTMVNHNPDRPIHVSTKRYSSTLSIASVRRTDAGQYRCEPHLAVPANVTIHVLAGENPAAMQRGRDGMADREAPVSDTSASGLPTSSASSVNCIPSMKLSTASASVTSIFQQLILCTYYSQGLILAALSFVLYSSACVDPTSKATLSPVLLLIADRSRR
ncbi:hypothetical protein HAZT_HAZT002998 [Hyalella azteca]|uniref:Ig-like domain-containing protein n=1 Tax=Hyalella azteca TaxID=294128 RepID=A0A6A0H402_HYAAZ|nr:hypothetical protein HAZT_HAZT002998 [Hyalella azteca]